MTDELIQHIKDALTAAGVTPGPVVLEHPDDPKHGDYSTNVALLYAKTLKMPPVKLAQALLEHLEKTKPATISKIEVAGAGFINFYLTPEFFAETLMAILKTPDSFGANKIMSGKKVLIEYTDPNPFKQFHIGHLMSNAIGESLSRIIAWSGATVSRACYQGDVGLHVAKAMWGILKEKENFPKENSKLSDRIKFLGDAYTTGARAYEEDDAAKKEIEAINRKVFEKTDPEINSLYEKGRAWSLEHFEEIYKLLGTKFDHYFFESEMAHKGLSIVEENLSKGVFEKSEGAIVFRGDKHGLHTRVFINSQGLPTYEAKELGLNKTKFETIADLDESIVITASEQDDYFKVVLKAIEQIFPDIAKKTRHLSHGMMRFASGKMSSRTGNVVTGESLLIAMENLVQDKMKERELPAAMKKKIEAVVGVGAIKYSVLKQATGSDIIYDFDKSISFEGDSGPYLQYAYTRARSVLEKADQEKIKGSVSKFPETTGELLRMLPRFPEVVERSMKEFAPHYIATYLIELAGLFNSYYAKEKIVEKGDELSPYRVAVTAAFAAVMKNGLWLLGIEVPEKM